MKALLSLDPGGPETLVIAELPQREPGPGEVRVRVHACALNFPDTLIIQDLYQVRPERPFAPGSDIAGIVEAIGEGVTNLKPGDRVFGAIGSGGLAQQAVTPSEKLSPIPEGIGFEAAAAFMLTYRTSYHALKDRAAARSGERVLVLGAGGGVGLAAVEIAKLMGLYVVAGASSQDKLDVAREYGADETLLYPAEMTEDDARAFSKRLKSEFPGGFDIIVDPVGGNYAEPSLRLLGYNGRYLVIGFPAGIPRVPFNLPLLKSCQVVGVFLGALTKADPDLDRRNTADLVALMAEGKLNPKISEIYDLEAGPKALVQLASRKAIGKLVVRL